MNLRAFDEKVHSLVLIAILFLTIVNFLIINHPLWFLPSYLFFLFLASYLGRTIFEIAKVHFFSLVFAVFTTIYIVLFPSDKLMIGNYYLIGGIKIFSHAIEAQNILAYKIMILMSSSFLIQKFINFEKVFIFLMESKKINVYFGYSLILAINSISKFKDEFYRIKINAKIRRLSFFHQVNLLFPMLVFAIKHADRGALSLYSRGLSTEKTFYFNVSINQKDKMVLIFYFSLNLICLSLDLFLR